eukprot:CAMPEP_0183563628 /NCGR_PEP_ID=MMETSP0371-20130417/102622_1 /TAXON_ID=268820 /ORGANISM="Peridinium aciculiferum, Strain PAER-2" /LENGTH=82 /DNA_ID=CAMNT_0025772517 /DNA_START=235 /DNA_END=483 /DNA_ORIENTATION=-
MGGEVLHPPRCRKRCDMQVPHAELLAQASILWEVGDPQDQKMFDDPGYLYHTLRDGSFRNVLKHVGGHSDVESLTLERQHLA